MTETKKEFKNIHRNTWIGLGKIVGAPNIGQLGDGTEFVTSTIRAVTYEMAPNGQGVETEMLVPLYSTVQTVINAFKHVIDNHHVMIDAYYKNWTDANGAQHTMFVTRINLGSKPYTPPTE